VQADCARPTKAAIAAMLLMVDFMIEEVSWLSKEKEGRVGSQ